MLLLGMLIGLVLRGCRKAPEPQEPKEPAVQEPVIPDGYVPLKGGDVHSGTLILVNNIHPFVFPAEQPLLSVMENKDDTYYVRDGSVLLAPEAMEALNAMMAAFSVQGGPKHVNVVAGHRTAEYQQHLFDQSAENNGQEHAEQYVAKSGYSEHHTGYAMDLSLIYPGKGVSEDFTGTGDYQWIADHAADYGFILRYGEGKQDKTLIAPESWHYRYVGIPHASEIARRGLCLEEYIDLLCAYPLEGPHLNAEAGGTRYEIYYCPAERAYVPEIGEYTVSGNNLDGYIVTVTLP